MKKLANNTCYSKLRPVQVLFGEPGGGTKEMSGICPLCNDLNEITIACVCGSKMKDAGPVGDYFGPYSPYLSLDLAAPYCRHLFSCPQCGRDKSVKIGCRKTF